MTQAATIEPIAVGPEDAARAAGISRSSVYEAIAKGELASFKAGKRRLILVEELKAWLNRLAKENAR